MRIIIQRKYMNLITFIILLSIIGSGCQSTDTRKFQDSKTDYGSRTDLKSKHAQGDRMYGATMLGGNNHENKKLAYSKELSTSLSDMSGIYSGLVMRTDKNAYAAFIFDNSGTGLKAKGTSRDYNHVGTTRGMYDTRTGNQTAEPYQIATGINTYYTEDKPENLSSELKQRIALTLRKKDPQILEVYITANRDFINQMNVYYTESVLGVDLNYYLDDFNKLVNEHFRVAK
jgi:hypothetical protein